MERPSVSVFHLHPLNRCNLRCSHCYSNSAPSGREYLSLEVANAAVDMAIAWGFRAIAISGGEPLLYPHLQAIVQRAKDLGMATSMITNGLRIRSKEDVAQLRELDVVSVSIDGLQQNHDRIRQRPGAFQRAGLAIARLVDAGINTRISCGITANNLHELELLIGSAACWGVGGISFHVASRIGRAMNMPQQEFLSQEDEVVLFASVGLLAACYPDQMDIRVDLLHRDTVLANPHLIQAKGRIFETSQPAELLDVLVMHSDGTLYPLCHGFSPSFGIGRFNLDWIGRHPEFWRHYESRVYPRLNQLGLSLLEELSNHTDRQVLNPNELLAERSWKSAPISVAVH